MSDAEFLAALMEDDQTVPSILHSQFNDFNSLLHTLNIPNKVGGGENNSNVLIYGGDYESDDDSIYDDYAFDDYITEFDETIGGGFVGGDETEDDIAVDLRSLEANEKTVKFTDLEGVQNINIDQLTEGLKTKTTQILPDESMEEEGNNAVVMDIIEDASEFTIHSQNNSENPQVNLSNFIKEEVNLSSLIPKTGGNDVDLSQFLDIVETSIEPNSNTIIDQSMKVKSIDDPPEEVLEEQITNEEIEHEKEDEKEEEKEDEEEMTEVETEKEDEKEDEKEMSNTIDLSKLIKKNKKKKNKKQKSKFANVILPTPPPPQIRKPLIVRNPVNLSPFVSPISL